MFLLDGRRYALPLSVVDRILRAVEVTPLPNAPPIVHGAINVHGRLIPVLNIRWRFGLPEREINPEDCLLVARTKGHVVALAVDASEGVIEHEWSDIVESHAIAAGLDGFPGVLGLEEGLLLIYDLETCLSLHDVRALDEAMREAST